MLRLIFFQLETQILALCSFDIAKLRPNLNIIELMALRLLTPK